MGNKKLYSIAETAKILRVTPRTVYRFVRQTNNPLGAAKIGSVWRIAEADLQRFIDNGRNNPKTGEK